MRGSLEFLDTLQVNFFGVYTSSCEFGESCFIDRLVDAGIGQASSV